MEFKLYFVCHQYEGLIASQLSPEEFGLYMAVGPHRKAAGEDIFFEVDPGPLENIFDMERARRETKQHSDGEPKRSRYISTYRVLERLPIEALGKLYLTTRDGRVLALDGENCAGKEPNGAGENMYMELCPLQPLVVASIPPCDFIRFMTNEEMPVYAPRIFFADLKLDRTERGTFAPYLPYPYPDHIQNCIDELKERNKKTKVVNRRPNTQGLFRSIRRGFFLGDQTQQRFYAFPREEELDTTHHQWWRSASLG